MIGVTQLLSTSEVSFTAPDGSANDPFTDFAQIAASGLSDGRYYLNDGTRTREYYMSINGTAANQSTGGWARIDSTSMGSNYSGQECVSGSGIINSSGEMRIRAVRSGGYGPTSHGGCGVGYNSTYFKARKFCFTGIVGSYPGLWYRASYLNIYTSPTTLRSDWYGNQSGNGGYYYPGAYAFPTNGETATVYVNNSISTPPPTNTTSLATSTQYAHNSSVGYGFTTGTVYDMFTTADRTFHFGQSTYGATNTEYGCTLWFKF
jgi:hypothetical protein